MTFQAVNVDEAKWLYDQLTPITPILVALSAATPIFRSYLADVDSRLVLLIREVLLNIKNEIKLYLDLKICGKQEVFKTCQN